MAIRESQSVRKLEWHLLPLDALAEVVTVLMHGKYGAGYGAHNWCSPPYFKREEIFNSLFRHYVDMRAGNKFDKKSGLYTAAHLAVNSLFALYYEMHSLWTDSDEDMPVPPAINGTLGQVVEDDRVPGVQTHKCLQMCCVEAEEATTDVEGAPVGEHYDVVIIDDPYAEKNIDGEFLSAVHTKLAQALETQKLSPMYVMDQDTGEVRLAQVEEEITVVDDPKAWLDGGDPPPGIQAIRDAIAERFNKRIKSRSETT